MNTLSLFDGMSCGQIALQKMGIKVDNYYASEIDKWAIQIAKKNFPDTIHIGDVTEVRAEDLPKIDLLMGGSPCQGFSFAGKQLNFDDPRSALFFQFVRLLRDCKPKYFLLENVRMKKEYQAVISEHLGVEPVMINSALVSAQNRVRLYWTNIPGIEQPEDKGIVLKDILEESPEDCTFMSDKFVNRNKDAGCLIDSNKPKASNLSAMEYVKNGRQGDYILCGRIVGRKINPETGKRDDYNPNLKTEQRIEARPDEKSGCLTTVQKDNVLIVPEATKKGYTEINEGGCFDLTFPNSKTRRGRNMKDKSNCLTAANYDFMRYEHPTYRKLTPVECERLQTVPDNYTEGVSNTQRYKMLGNGWTVDVIAHILQGVKEQQMREVA